MKRPDVSLDEVKDAVDSTSDRLADAAGMAKAKTAKSRQQGKEEGHGRAPARAEGVRRPVGPLGTRQAAVLQDPRDAGEDRPLA